LLAAGAISSFHLFSPRLLKQIVLAAIFFAPPEQLSRLSLHSAQTMQNQKRFSVFDSRARDRSGIKQDGACAVLFNWSG
jgi:hypothetical protein